MIDFQSTTYGVRAWLTCDKCKSVIASVVDDSLDGAISKLPTEQHEDLNRGHECRSCRQKRRDAYDRWVTSPSRS